MEQQYENHHFMNRYTLASLAKTRTYNSWDLLVRAGRLLVGWVITNDSWIMLFTEMLLSNALMLMIGAPHPPPPATLPKYEFCLGSKNG